MVCYEINGGKVHFDPTYGCGGSVSLLLLHQQQVTPKGLRSIEMPTSMIPAAPAFVYNRLLPRNMRLQIISQVSFHIQIYLPRIKSQLS